MLPSSGRLLISFVVPPFSYTSNGGVEHKSTLCACARLSKILTSAFSLTPSYFDPRVSVEFLAKAIRFEVKFVGSYFALLLPTH